MERALKGSYGDVISKIAKVKEDSVHFNDHTFGNIFRRKRKIEGRLQCSECPNGPGLNAFFQHGHGLSRS